MKTYNTLQDWLAEGNRVQSSIGLICNLGKKKSNAKSYAGEVKCFENLYNLCQSKRDYFTMIDTLIKDINAGYPDGKLSFNIYLHSFLWAACIQFFTDDEIRKFKDSCLFFYTSARKNNKQAGHTIYHRSQIEIAKLNELKNWLMFKN